MKLFKWFPGAKKTPSESEEFNSAANKARNALSYRIDVFHQAFKFLNEKHKIEEVPPVINEILFFEISFRDILLSTQQFKNAQSPDERNLQARELAQHIHELLDDSKQMLGKKVRNALLHFPDSAFLLNELNYLQTILRALRKLMFSHLQEIRHNTAAHKTHQSLMLSEKIKNIDEKTIDTYGVLT